MLLSAEANRRLLWSSCHPRSGVGRGRGPHRRMARPFRHAYRSGVLRPRDERAETAWDFHRSVWTTIVSRRNHQSPCRSTTATVTCRPEELPEHADSPRASRVGELGPPTRPKRGPSRTILAGPSVSRPLLERLLAAYLPAGEFEQGLPYEARPRTGRIKSIGVDRSHRLQTEPPHLRFTPSPKRKRGFRRRRIRDKRISHSRLSRSFTASRKFACGETLAYASGLCAYAVTNLDPQL